MCSLRLETAWIFLARTARVRRLECKYNPAPRDTFTAFLAHAVGRPLLPRFPSLKYTLSNIERSLEGKAQTFPLNLQYGPKFPSYIASNTSCMNRAASSAANLNYQS